MKVLVTGASGQLGNDICRELNRRGIAYKGVSSAEMELTDAAAVERVLDEFRPDAVIHCAAYTKVDFAEDEPEICWSVNAGGTWNLVRLCKVREIKVLYISTDYVFPGDDDRFYETEDAFHPGSVYGASKLAGELIVKSLLKKYFIVRISWVFGINGQNFVKTMLKLSESRTECSVVCDQIGSPTYTTDLAPLLCDMILTEQYGIYHATNDGVCSWAEFAEEIFRLAGKQVKVNHVITKDYPVKARRPLNSRLSKRKLEESGFQSLPDWRDALKRYLECMQLG